MNQSVYKTAEKFKNKSLKGNVNFKTASSYLQSIGFPVLFYNTGKDNELLVKYNLTELSKTVKGFTVCRKDFKAVFIDDSSPCEEKLYVLLHEAAHIVLGHMDKRDIKDGRLIEMEADAFAYAVLNPPKSNLPKVIAICLTVLLTVFGVYLYEKDSKTIFKEDIPIKTAIVTQTEVQTQEQAQTVYVTPKGAKFHRSDCRYVKNKDCKTFTRTQALEKYSPCSVCNP